MSFKNSNQAVFDFFTKHPHCGFGLKTLCDLFGNDVHKILVNLESKKMIIRFKIDIKGKPVTHWQLNDRYDSKHNDLESIPYYDVNKKHTSFDIRKSIKNNFYATSPNNSTLLNIQNSSIPIQFSYKEKNYFSQSYKKVDEETKYSDKNKFIKSKLNPYCAEFKPKLLEETSGINRSKSLNSADSQITNLHQPFMTSMTKNPVSVLHEFCQLRGITCEFKILEIDGPAHKPRISTAVCLNERQFEPVFSANKKEGKRKAADLAIRSLISERSFIDSFSSIAETLDNDLKSKELKSHMGKSNPCYVYDHIVSLVYAQFAEIINIMSPKEGLSMAGRKVIAAIVMENEKSGKFKVVSLSTGNRCITGDKISLQGNVINDSHAEVVSRRAFMYFLYKQLNAHVSRSSSSLGLFEEIDCSITFPSVVNRFRIKDHLKFHLYISTAPCGDGALFCTKESIEKNQNSQVIMETDHQPIYENGSQGLLRTKIEGGEGTIPIQNSDDCIMTQTLDGILQGERLRTMSCSDKIARWNYLGIQGSLLEIFLKPIYIKSLILGSLFNAGHLSRAVCCRLEKSLLSPLRMKCNVNHPKLVSVNNGDLHREIDKSSELSINWCLGESVEIVDGVTGKLSMKECPKSELSRISKASLFHEFYKINSKLKNSRISMTMTYREVKSLSKDYEERKKALFLKFHCVKYGSWICKPSEQSEFRNFFNVEISNL